MWPYFNSPSFHDSVATWKLVTRRAFWTIVYHLTFTPIKQMDSLEGTDVKNLGVSFKQRRANGQCHAVLSLSRALFFAHPWIFCAQHSVIFFTSEAHISLAQPLQPLNYGPLNYHCAMLPPHLLERPITARGKEVQKWLTLPTAHLLSRRQQQLELKPSFYCVTITHCFYCN